MARLLAGLRRSGLTPDAEIVWWLTPINGQTGIVVLNHGAVYAVIDVAVRDGRVVELATVVAPDKLRRWQDLPRLDVTG